MTKLSIGLWLMLIGALFLIFFGILSLTFVAKNDVSLLRLCGIGIGEIVSLCIFCIGYKHEKKRKEKNE